MSTPFSPSPAELALVSQIFAQADPQKLGIITGDVAVRVFGGAKLSPTVLGEIWNLADEENKGWLPKRGVAIAVRLMGWAQKGEKVNQALIGKPGPLPTIEGLPAPLTQQNTGISIPKSPPPGLPLLTPQNKAKFQRLFSTCGPTNGLLSADKARDVFVKSKLPVEKLGQIWNLADTQDRGALDSTDFAIGMYLIQASMSGQLSFIPTSLPPGLYEQAGGGARVATHATGSSSFTPSPTGTFSSGTRSAIQPQYTGQTVQPQTTGLPFKPPGGPPLPSRPSARVPPFPPPQAQAWDITPAEKASADRFFDTLDTQKKGYIEGDVAVPFMLQSNLAEDVLAHVWDLSDINNDGRLTRDGFAVAMHLIQTKLAGKDIPTTLPSSLIPPSMRTNGAAPVVPAQPQEPLRDLLWDETPPSSAISPQSPAQPSQVQQQSTGFGQQPISFGQQSSSFGQQSSPFTATPRAVANPNQDPFGSSFGASAHRDLLGDDDEPVAASPPLHDQSAEIGNVQNQLNSTNRSLETTKSERATIEQTLANQAAQLSALQTQLSSAKAAYETETKLLSTLRERHATQTADIQKAREELIRAESDLSAVRVEKAEVEGAFLRDKEEVRELQRQMTESGSQVETLKAQTEKAKKEAKQQKGLLAIARKQLSTKEAERARAEKELADANAELEQEEREREQVEAELAREVAPAVIQNPHRTKSPSGDSVAFAAAHALPVTPEVASPTASIMGKSNNPFERLVASSGTSSPRSQSPFLPFAEASVPTPPTAAAVASVAAVESVDHDPFGFSQAFAGMEPPVTDAGGEVAVTEEAQNLTPQPEPATNARANSLTSPISPKTSESEFFSTPPTTANGQSPEAAIPQFPSLDGATSQFPEIDSQQSAHQEYHGPETDLGAELKELDVDESDDSDSDNEPLADRRASLTDKAFAPANIDSLPVANGNGTSQIHSAFDDAFGQTTPKQISPMQSGATSPPRVKTPDVLATAASTDAFGAPITKAPSPFEPPTTSVVPSSVDATLESAPAPSASAASGVNAFDEAMGKIPGTGPSPAAAEFSFDSAFDDNFDFASASAQTSFKPSPAAQPSFPPPPTSSVNGRSTSSTSPRHTGDHFDSVFAVPPNPEQPAPPTAQEQGKFSFDDAFASSSTPAPPQANQTTGRPDQNNMGISFDEAFGGFDASNSLKLGDNLGSVSSKASAAAPVANTMNPFPSGSPPLSPKNGPSSPRIVSMRSMSPPPREMTPPPRVSSPRGRPSTSSSGKEPTPERPKEPPVRHSKLSIRLPFGKKKSKQQAEAPPPPPVAHSSQFLSPVEEPTRTLTPAVDDDVDAVKQLCGMGFSRTQAVTALERQGYDVQKALNSLLGSQ